MNNVKKKYIRELMNLEKQNNNEIILFNIMIGKE